MRALLAIALLPGCLGGTYLDRDLACEYDVFNWLGGLSRHADVGESDGDLIRFDYPTNEAWITRINGRYNTLDGEFSVQYDYFDGYFMSVYEAEGYGTVYTDGDLDVLSTVYEEDVLGDSVLYQERHLRSGCDGTIRTRYPEGSSRTPYTTNYTIVSDTQVDYDSVIDYDDGGRVTREWTMNDALDVAGTVVSDADGVNYSSEYTQDVDANFESTWTQESTDFDYVGTTTRDVTGFNVQEYDGVEHGTGNVLFHLRSERNYDGSGTGSYQDFTQDLTCDVTYGSNGSCDLSCSNGYEGRC
ncbi:MAG: hypothetical protein H6739_06015 [Alphaproteobacteria bacterium]|nr:hypothetical protein [Alphaproteobacteria bacterium]